MKERCEFMDAYIGEIRLFSFGFAPKAWLPCEGQTLARSQYPKVFALLGNYYGGDGSTNFKLPDLRGRTPRHSGGDPASPKLGESGGSETTALAANQIPDHSHYLLASAITSTLRTPSGNMIGKPAANNLYSSTLSPLVSIGNTGSTGGTPFNRRQPYQTVFYAICVDGIYPSRP